MTLGVMRMTIIEILIEYLVQGLGLIFLLSPLIFLAWIVEKGRSNGRSQCRVDAKQSTYYNGAW